MLFRSRGCGGARGGLARPVCAPPALGGMLRHVFQIEVEVCPACGGAMRIIAFIAELAVVRRILAHLERGGIDARAGPWAGAAPAPG